MRTLITGVSGFIGARLAEACVAQGDDVVGFCRHPNRVTIDVPVFGGDAVTGEGLDDALAGVDVAYYLIHSFEAGQERAFAERDRQAACNFVASARAADVERVIYLGVFKPANGALSPHLASRGEVEQIIRAATPTSLALRTSLILSAHNPVLEFQLRLIERMPVLARTPSSARLWQPIDARDVIASLVAAARWNGAAGQALDVAGPEVLPYGEISQRIANELGLERDVVDVPALDPAQLGPELAKQTGGDPVLIRAMLETAAVGDSVAQDNGAKELGVVPRAFDESIHWVVQEHRARASAAAGKPAPGSVDR